MIDTHCHLNMMVKSELKRIHTDAMIEAAKGIVADAQACDVTHVITVGTSRVESDECVQLAVALDRVYATVGIHPNDGTDRWRKDVQLLERHLKQEARDK
jgi:Tat protein secretion system quality control protein TatD with DNase activity